MSFYQACYTRVGKQERDAGWHVVAATDGLSKEALEHFRFIASNVIQKKGAYQELPSEIFLIQEDKRFAYICNIVLNCAGSDGRSNSFVHGLIIAKNEYYRNCRLPASVFGMEENEFIRRMSGWNGGLPGSIPMKDICSFQRWDRTQILEEYKLSGRYYELMLCVFSVLERQESSLCLCMGGGHLDELRQIGRKVLFCIMDGLPEMLRPQLTCSSFDIGNGKVSFSICRPETKQEFFDLETGERSCPLACIEHYSFIELFITDDSISDPNWKRTEEFFEMLVSNKRQFFITCLMVENVYRFYCGKNPENAAECLGMFLEVEPFVCPLLYRFLSYLLLWTDVKQLEPPIQEKLLYLCKRNENRNFVEIMGRKMQVSETANTEPECLRGKRRMWDIFGGAETIYQMIKTVRSRKESGRK